MKIEVNVNCVFVLWALLIVMCNNVDDELEFDG